MCFKRNIFNQCVLSLHTNGAKVLVLRKNTVNKARVTQSVMELRILGDSLKNLIPKAEIRP